MMRNFCTTRFLPYFSYLLPPHVIRITIWVGVGLFVLSSCSRTIEKGKYLLYSQSVKGSKQIPAEQLELLIPQKPNRKFLRTPLMPYLSIYRLGELFYHKDRWEKRLADLESTYEQKSLELKDNPEALLKLRRKKDRKATRYEKKITQGNTLMSSVGEAPSYFYDKDAQKNVKNMENYLISKGFFLAKVAYKKDTLLFNQMKVAYTVNERCGFHFRNITLTTTDERIDSLIKANKKDSYLVAGKSYDAELITAESVRMELLLRSNGYYKFSRNYFHAKVSRALENCELDSLNTWVDVEFQLNNPPKSQKHPYYHIGNVEMVVNGSSEIYETTVDSSRYNGLKYIFVGRRYNTKILDSKIFIRPSKLFSISDLYETQRQLSNLDQFKFADPSFEEINGKLNARIYTVPLDKYQITTESGLSVFQQVPGPFGSVSMKVRNIFKGLESLETNFRAGYEGQTGFFLTDSVYQSLEVSANTSLIFPKVLLPGKIASWFNPYNPRTQLGLGYNYTNRPEYNRTNFKLAMNYTWRLNQEQSFNLSLFDLNFIQTKFKLNQFEQFLQDELQNGNNLYYSFKPSFVSSISASYIYNTNQLGKNQKAKYLKVFLESGGTTLNFLNQSTFSFLDKIFDTLQYYRFLKINVDFRYYLPVGPKKRSTVAFRVNSGVAYSYGSDVKVLPYEKYFFVGGTNSIRAWRLRRLGPGSTTPKASSINENYTPESPGDVLLESSLEYRFPLFKLGGMLNGALFLDAGNVWNLRNISNNEKAVFKFDRFFKEIAIGTGFGVRYDFTYFVIRGDFGLRVHDPSRDEGDRWVLFRSGVNNKLLFNLGIGYPF
ncbi:MAG: BamA/TamA family outer membrane protein [Spirosomataceae bacterium]